MLLDPKLLNKSIVRFVQQRNSLNKPFISQVLESKFALKNFQCLILLYVRAGMHPQCTSFLVKLYMGGPLKLQILKL
jgi:hypothetical protein